jgi:MurNAc alpha-1-phosphate uridylyltransferase
MSIALTHAIILAAGLGTRMRPLTNSLPKPLIPVRGTPLIDWCITWLKQAGITNITVNSSYLAEMLEAHLQTSHEEEIHLSREEPLPLETGGGIAKALPLLGTQPFLAMNSDAILCDENTAIAALEAAWNETEMDFLMLLVPREHARGWEGNGDFVREASGRIRKPRAGEVAPYIFTGIEMIHPRVFTDCPSGAFSLNELWKRSLESDGFYGRIRSVIMQGTWLNVGDLNGLATAEAYLQRGA